MPRISADALLTPTPRRDQPKLDVPYDFDERKGAVWRSVVNAMPSDYFSSAQVDHLRSYCTAVCIVLDLEAELAAEMRRKKPREKVIDRKRSDLKQWLMTKDRLARSMRLTHQSVMHNETAATAHRRGKVSAADIMRELNEDAFTEAES